MATGCLRVKKPPQMRVTIDGALPEWVSAKDVALYLIGRFGAAGGKRCAIEFAGSTVANMAIEARLTLCNLAVEFAAFTALIAPDEKTWAYIQDRPFGMSHQDALDLADAARLQTDPGATFDHEIVLDAGDITPQVSWGTSPEHSFPIGSLIPQDAPQDALEYMGLHAGQSLASVPIQGAFIGSCTNGRLSDLRSAAAILRGRKIAPGVRAVCVPGSQAVRKAAEREGIDQIFRRAGFEWGSPGCAMCFYAGGETFDPGSRVISSTNRNFKGRQGPGVRTHLSSPAVVAASAVSGCITNPALMLQRYEVA